MQRSGSGWFETLLNSHENISSNGEIFSVKERRSNITAITKTLDKLYNLDWVSSAAKNECTAAVGLKWMLNQVHFGMRVLFGYSVEDLKITCLPDDFLAKYHFMTELYAFYCTMCHYIV
jgi:hypothetical protein